MYIHCTLFFCLFLQFCCFIFSLYIVGWLVTLPCEISVQSPTICINSHYSVRGQSVVCVHTLSESDNAFQRCGHLNFL